MGLPHRTVRSRSAALALSSATAVALATTSAIAFVGGNGNGNRPVTSGPDLQSVAIVGSYEPGDGQTRQVKYCFDASIGGVPGPGGFVVQTYDSTRRMISTAAAPSGGAGNDNCVTASFAASADLTQGTIGTVNGGAATDRNGKGNIPGSEKLDGSGVTPAAGQTSSPDLLNASINATDPNHVKITYNFDQIISRAGASVANFGYEKANGDVVFGRPASNGPDGAPGGGDDVPASAVVDGGGSKSIIIDFLDDAAAPSAGGFETKAGAVSGAAQSDPAGGAPSTPGISRTGGPSRPKLTEAAPAGARQFTLTFDKNVTVAGNGDFYAILDNGVAVPVAANGVGTGGAPNKLLVTFAGAVGDDSSHTVRILADAGATRDAGDGTTPSLPSQVNVSTAPALPGLTNGPDLLRVGLDPSTYQATFTFDDRVPDAPPAAAAFKAYAADGSQINADAALSSSGNAIVVRFPTTVTGAVAYATTYGGVTNRVNGVSPLQSVSKDLINAPVVTPPTPTPTPTKPSSPSRKRYKTGFAIAHRRGRIYSGRITSALKSCKKSRTVIIRKVSKGGAVRYGTARTNSSGTFKIKRSRTLGAKVYISAVEKKTSKYICSSRKSKTFRG